MKVFEFVFAVLKLLLLFIWDIWLLSVSLLEFFFPLPEIFFDGVFFLFGALFFFGTPVNCLLVYISASFYFFDICRVFLMFGFRSFGNSSISISYSSWLPSLSVSLFNSPKCAVFLPLSEYYTFVKFCGKIIAIWLLGWKDSLKYGSPRRWKWNPSASNPSICCPTSTLLQLSYAAVISSFEPLFIRSATSSRIS